MSTDALFEESTEPRREVMTVRQINEGISDAIERAFPGTVWVRGEVQRLPHDAARRTHVYFELHETGGSGAADYQISTSLMGWDRQRFNLGRYLDGTDPDFQIANQMEVCLECKVDFYAKFGKMSLKVVGVDKSFVLGRLEARRREILAYLKQEDLLEKNAALPFPELPLRIGLITSPGSAAERDFMTGIEDSRWAFRVRLRGAKMQGEQLQPEVIRALEGHAAAGVDVIVITRGGGSRADLSWFDQRDLAVAIAECSVPVITAIGHEIDTSIADLVAHHACKTPTAAAEFLVETVDEASNRLEEATERLGRAAEGICLRARVRYQSAAGRMQDRVSRSLEAGRGVLADLRTGLGTIAVTRISYARETLGGLQVGLAGAAAALTAIARREQESLTGRLVREAVRPVVSQGARLEGLAAQTRLMDPDLLLARGFTITLDEQGRAVTKAASLAPGNIIGTRFSDGLVRSIVQPGHELAAGGKSSKKGKRSGGKKDKAKKGTGQKTLFR
ncbi:MAG: exodeoxyribonuclease VII large subunit [Candidatus Krumholzibacteria bacterium]|nr:exodeoxyribonuclease VII large subunit [Candidatus Krumholzibacteria bacterium]